MPKTLSVFNVTSGKRLKFRQAERLVEKDRICAWVEKPRTIRTLNLAEQIAARNEAARMRAPLEYAEVRDVRFQPPVTSAAKEYREYRWLRQEAEALCAGPKVYVVLGSPEAAECAL